MENYYIISNEINLYTCYAVYEDEYKAYINYNKTNNKSKFIFEIPKKYIQIYGSDDNLYCFFLDKKFLSYSKLKKIDKEKLKLVKILY